MLTIADIKRHVAQDRPSELHLSVEVSGEWVDEIHTDPRKDIRVGNILRVAEGYVELAAITGKTVSFEHVV